MPFFTETQDALENTIEQARDPFIKYVETQPDAEERIKLMVAFGSFSVLRSSFKNQLEIQKITKLMEYIVRGQEEPAKKMLELFPCLLLNNTANVIDYSGREVKNLTPFQATLCASDVGLCKMIQKIFQAHPEKTGGLAEMARQFAEVFPEKKEDSQLFPEAEGGFSGHLQRQQEHIFDFNGLAAAIDRATDDELQTALDKQGASFMEATEVRGKPDDQLTLTEKLNRFREQFAKKSRSEIIFNPQHLLTAFKIYEVRFDVWDQKKRHLFWRQVIGFVQRFLPAGDAQAFAQGLYDIVQDEKPLKRSFNLTCEMDQFYPVAFNFCGLGFDYAVRVWQRLCGLRVWKNPTDCYKIYIEQKHSVWKTYAEPSATADSLWNFVK